MELIWVILSTTLFSATIAITCRYTYIRGYKAGAQRVIDSWKKTLDEQGEEYYE